MDLQELDFIGGDSALFRRYLEEDDPCFGRSFAKSAIECQQCTRPVVFEGKVTLLSDVCRAFFTGGSANVIRRLTTREVETRLKNGKSIKSIFIDILNGCDVRELGAAARQLLYDRLWYLKQTQPVPDLPKLKELI